MKAISPHPTRTTASGRVVWRNQLAEPVAEPSVSSRPTQEALCLECAHAELYAEQPRAHCRCGDSSFAGRVVFAGQPACDKMTPRDENDLTLAWCSPGLKAAPARGAQPRPPAR